MSRAQSFYNKYHKKNDRFSGVINEQNFTYYEILRFFYQKVRPLFPRKTQHSADNSRDLSDLRILDVGCGVGTLALYFASKGAEVSGVDISDRAISIAQEAADAMQLPISFNVGEVKKGSPKYDMVIISEVIEHIPNQEQFLSLLRSHLKKDGLLFLTTPLKENMLYKLGVYNKFDQEVGHVRRYTRDGLISLLCKNDFCVQHFRLVEGPMRNLLYITRLGFLIRFIRGPLVPIYHFFDHLSLLVFGASNILVVARKR